MFNPQAVFGQIDIYLFDQVLRGRIQPGMRIFDAGCGFGRNLVYFLREGYEILGADADPAAIEYTRQLAASHAPALPPGNFRAERIESMSFPDAFADVALSSAVLHFARDDDQFEAMLRGTWRVLKPEGSSFAGSHRQSESSAKFSASADADFYCPMDLSAIWSTQLS